jgi:N-acetylmuramoyl-L-alanine amidase
MPQWKGIVGEGFKPKEFDDYVRKLTFAAWRPQFVVLHNTSKPRFSQWHSTPGSQRMQNLVHYYRNEMKWSAGPHLFIADDLIWVFTPLTTSGRHSPSWNLTSWGVEMVGEYQEEVFGNKVRDNTVAALATLHAVLGRDPKTLRFHKEDEATTHKTCPGRNVNKEDVIKRVQDNLLKRYSGEHTPDGPE